MTGEQYKETRKLLYLSTDHKELLMTGPTTITQEQIDAFVAAWYLALDQHVPLEQIGSFVADDVEMIFPEKTLHGKSDFLAWCAGGTYSDGEKAPGVFNIFFDENHNVVSVETAWLRLGAELDVVVAWQASWFVPPAAKSKRVSLDAIQKWRVVPSDQNPYGLVVTSYNAMAKPFVYAPGFARL
jgi:hypothetical protein